MPHPPLEDQRRILDYLATASARLDPALERLRREVSLLVEYRTRLVADVVTGKLDVREAAARLPDDVPPDTVEDDTDMSDDPDAPDNEADAE